MCAKIVGASLFVCLIPALAAAQAAYTVTDLSTLSPTAINIWAQVVGNYNTQAYIWSFGHRRTLGKLSGGTFSRAAAINDLGVVTGTADGVGTVIDPVFGNHPCSDLIQPFLWKNNAMQGLGTIATTGLTGLGVDCFLPYYATAINDSGQLVGNTAFLADLFQWGFSQNSSSGFTLFGGSWQPTFVNGISNTGQIVGENADGPFEGHATSWKGGVATDLGSLLSSGNIYGSAANGVNDLGAIVGWSVIAPIIPDDCFDFISQRCPMHAVLWTDTGAITDLGTLPGDTLSSATKINRFGLVIGSSGSSVAFQQDPQTGVQGPPAVTGRPFLWSQAKGMQDLNTLIPSNSGWVLNTATDINVWGQIVGEGELNGQPHGYLLTPKNPF